MKNFALLFVLFALTSCTTLEKIGHGVCSAEQQVSASITEAAAWLGAPGVLAGKIISGVMHVGCVVFNAVVSLPADSARMIGIGTQAADHAAEAKTDK